MPLLEVEDLQVEFGAVSAPIVAVDGVDLMLDVGEVVGCVGESGSGKSVTALALMGLTEFPGRVRAKRLAFAGRARSSSCVKSRSRTRRRGSRRFLISSRAAWRSA